MLNKEPSEYSSLKCLNRKFWKPRQMTKEMTSQDQMSACPLY